MTEPKRQLVAQLAEIEAIIRLISTAISLRPRLSSMLRWDSIVDHEQKLAADFMKNREADARTVLKALLVVSYGLLENFVKELVERAVQALNSGCKDPAKLSQSILDENIFRTGQVLQTVKTGSRTTGIEYDLSELAQGLTSCLPPNLPLSLNAACFSFGHGIVTPDNLDKLLDRLGVNLDWDRFGADTRIQKILGQTHTRDCSKETRRAVEALVRDRNIVSHTGDLNRDLVAEEVEKYTRLLPAFCEVLTVEVGRQMDKKFG